MEEHCVAGQQNWKYGQKVGGDDVGGEWRRKERESGGGEKGRGGKLGLRAIRVGKKLRTRGDGCADEMISEDEMNGRIYLQTYWPIQMKSELYWHWHGPQSGDPIHFALTTTID